MGDDSAEELEQRISGLRVAIRQAVRDGDPARVAALRRDLRHTEEQWEAALDAEAGPGLAPAAIPLQQSMASPAPQQVSEPAPPRAGSLIPLRGQVHEALSVLQVPTAPRMIATVHEAFFATTFPTARLTSLRRDEERSFSVAPFARPYYICAALAADSLTPSRGLLAVSTWPMEDRIIGSLSPRVDFLVSAINVAEAIEHIPDPVPAARALLARFAANVRGSSGAGAALEPGGDQVDPQAVIRAARAELAVHQDEDRRARAEAARRARETLPEVQQLFGFQAADGARTRKAGRG